MHGQKNIKFYNTNFRHSIYVSSGTEFMILKTQNKMHIYWICEILQIVHLNIKFYIAVQI